MCETKTAGHVINYKVQYQNKHSMNLGEQFINSINGTYYEQGYLSECSTAAWRDGCLKTIVAKQTGKKNHNGFDVTGNSFWSQQIDHDLKVYLNEQLNFSTQRTLLDTYKSQIILYDYVFDHSYWLSKLTILTGDWC